MCLNGHTIVVKDLGTFKVSFSAKAPLTSDEAGAKQIWRRRILYYPSASIKDEIDNTELVCLTKLSWSGKNYQGFLGFLGILLDSYLRFFIKDLKD